MSTSEFLQKRNDSDNAHFPEGTGRCKHVTQWVFTCFCTTTMSQRNKLQFNRLYLIIELFLGCILLWLISFGLLQFKKNCYILFTLLWRFMRIYWVWSRMVLILASILRWTTWLLPKKHHCLSPLFPPSFVSVSVTSTFCTCAPRCHFTLIPSSLSFVASILTCPPPPPPLLLLFSPLICPSFPPSLLRSV